MQKKLNTTRGMLLSNQYDINQINKYSDPHPRKAKCEHRLTATTTKNGPHLLTVEKEIRKITKLF
jgi:hypothetical protein